MIALASSFAGLLAQAPLPASSDFIPPILILALCAVAGLGTVMLLPGRHEMALHKIGGLIVAVAGLIFLALTPRLFFGTIGASEVYFWIFSAIALGGALRVVTHPKPVYSALYFVLTVFASAGLFVLLEAEFLAAALVLIYAGAILITYLFVIMLASQATSASDAPTASQVLGEYDRVSREPLAAAAIGFALMGVLLFVIFDKAGQLASPAGANAQPTTIAANVTGITGATQELGLYLFRSQVIQVELAGLILTLAMVGAMVISRRHVFTDPSLAPTHGHQKPQPMVTGPNTPVDDNPHSIPVYGTDNPRQKAYPQA